MQQIKNEGKKYFKKNQLNNLTGKEWMKNTKSWFILTPSKRRNKILHPACFAEELAERFILFFSKENEWVFDPFAGIGSTLIAAKKLYRNSIGIELYKKYVNYANDKLISIKNSNKSILINDDSRKLLNIFSAYELPQIDLSITSPPYWNQLNQNHRRQQKRINNNIDTDYGNKKLDLSNIDDYNIFLEELKYIFNQVYQVTNDFGYLIIITNNIYKNRKFWPLAFDTFKIVSNKWTAYDEQIWCQDDKNLLPFGIFDKYIGNRCHHYCLIFRKEK